MFSVHEPGKMLPSRISKLLETAADSGSSPDLLEKLSCHTHFEVRLAVARNSSTPHHVVARLAHDNDVNVRLGIAKDSNTPLEILNLLSEDRDLRVRNEARKTRRVFQPLVARSLYDPPFAQA